MTEDLPRVECIGEEQKVVIPYRGFLTFSDQQQSMSH